MYRGILPNFNMSLQEGDVPVEWKEAKTIPLFKKGSRNKSLNYRPVSLTSENFKLIQTIIIRDQKVDFLIKHKLIKISAWVLKSKMMPNKFDMVFLRKFK